MESDGQRPDDDVASETWQKHRLRNDSILVDSCQGLLKSCLTCPNCHQESIKFDPYMSLSLPLPSPNNGVEGVSLQSCFEAFTEKEQLHCLHSNFSPSRPLQLWFEAACETSLARDIYAMQSTQKDVEGATALFVCLFCRSG